jgi:hypothetical protein
MIEPNDNSDLRAFLASFDFYFRVCSIGCESSKSAFGV